MKYEMIYICDKCNREFRDEGKCKQHEQNEHVEIDVFNLSELRTRYAKTERYPGYIYVPMKDGSIMAYAISHRYKSSPTEKESPQNED